ncbi:hypothetical protein JZ751_008065 [Albula glossodonta]|uniref:Uncharacterized protein n=1 Tax=Albula glossodonta TaxID=121402 RepID=A0A8T2P3A7_9TELE|nr:hypothetical protein JZ751_008065 [Albula glossodonta]
MNTLEKKRLMQRHKQQQNQRVEIERTFTVMGFESRMLCIGPKVGEKGLARHVLTVTVFPWDTRLPHAALLPRCTSQ